MRFVPNLDYPVTRTYPGRYFAPIAFGGAFVVLLLLATINAALAGYETVTGFESDFNVTQSLWFHRFLPSAAKSKPGTLCDPRLLGRGDTITTNYTMFQYTIASVNTANAGNSNFLYRGGILNNCDITSLYVNGDTNTFMIDYTALVTCRADEAQRLQGNDFEITARADFTESTLSGKYGTLFREQKAFKKAGNFNQSNDARAWVRSSMLSASGSEFATRALILQALTNGSFPTIMSFRATFPWCPASLGPDAPCAVQVPPLNITDMFEYTPGRVIQLYSSSGRYTKPLLTNDTLGIVSNTVQAVYAAVRLDLGNPSPNNFLLNTSIISDAITGTFPQTHPNRPGFPDLPTKSYLYSILVNDGSPSNLPVDFDIPPGLLPLTSPGPAVLDGVYLCRFQRPKPPRSAFIAVLVATLSMFTTGWAIFLFIAEAVVKEHHKSSANACEGHTMLPTSFTNTSRESLTSVGSSQCLYAERSQTVVDHGSVIVGSRSSLELVPLNRLSTRSLVTPPLGPVVM
ncbi:hypothetical protein C8J57DRAFT_1164079 [Mycena rebaudengoi]|nr:hypothetical protein C8J57DRAFT_1164079 [Mycena rebaudengoi]